MAEITQDNRLEAVLSKLESVENELRQVKRIIQYFALCDQSMEQRDTEVHKVSGESSQVDRGTNEGLYPGQLPYQPGDGPKEIEKQKQIIKQEEVGSCVT
jgi:hypothetical protein